MLGAPGTACRGAPPRRHLYSAFSTSMLVSWGRINKLPVAGGWSMSLFRRAAPKVNHQWDWRPWQTAVAPLASGHHQKTAAAVGRWGPDGKVKVKMRRDHRLAIWNPDEPEARERGAMGGAAAPPRESQNPGRREFPAGGPAVSRPLHHQLPARLPPGRHWRRARNGFRLAKRPCLFDVRAREEQAPAHGGRIFFLVPHSE